MIVVPAGGRCLWYTNGHLAPPALKSCNSFWRSFQAAFDELALCKNGTKIRWRAKPCAGPDSVAGCFPAAIGAVVRKAAQGGRPERVPAWRVSPACLAIRLTQARRAGRGKQHPGPFPAWPAEALVNSDGLVHGFSVGAWKQSCSARKPGLNSNRWCRKTPTEQDARRYTI